MFSCRFVLMFLFSRILSSPVLVLLIVLLPATPPERIHLAMLIVKSVGPSISSERTLSMCCSGMGEDAPLLESRSSGPRSREYCEPTGEDGPFQARCGGLDCIVVGMVVSTISLAPMISLQPSSGFLS